MERKPASLLDCPPEIRNMIWKLVLGDRQLHLEDRQLHLEALHPGDRPRYITRVSRPARPNEVSLSHRKREKSTDRFNTALLRVNRQVQAEADFIFYSTNVFTFHYGDQIRRWMRKRTPTQVAWIKAVGLQFHHPDDDGDEPFIYEMLTNDRVKCMPPNVESLHIASFTPYGWPGEAQMMVIDDLNETVAMALKNKLKVKTISITVFADQGTWSPKFTAKMRCLAYCRDKALKYLREKYDQYGPYDSWEGGEYEWIHEKVTLESYILDTLNTLGIRNKLPVVEM